MATECLAGMGDRARLPWALAIWPVGCGPLKPGGLHYSNGPTQFPIISNYIKLAKYESCTFCSPKFPNFTKVYKHSRGTTFLLGRDSNSQQILN
jgi:hypothetical protein